MKLTQKDCGYYYETEECKRKKDRIKEKERSKRKVEGIKEKEWKIKGEVKKKD